MFTNGLTNPLPAIERLFKREEADVILVAGNLALVVLEVVEWPVALLTLLVHGLARTRFKALEALAEVAEEVD